MKKIRTREDVPKPTLSNIQRNLPLGLYIYKVSYTNNSPRWIQEMEFFFLDKPLLSGFKTIETHQHLIMLA